MGEGVEQPPNEQISIHDYTDKLTGLFNRLWLEQKLEKEVSNHPGEIALLFIDIDRLKKINDTWGHAEGDILLQDTATILDDSVRRTRANPPGQERRAQPERPKDTWALTGKSHAVHLHGDEFALLLMGSMTEQDLQSIKDRVQNNLSENDIEASVGGKIHQKGESGSELLKAADLSMLADKRMRTEVRLQEQLQAAPRWKRAIFRIGQSLVKASEVELPR